MDELSSEAIIRRYRAILQSGQVSDPRALRALRELLGEEQTKMLAKAQSAKVSLDR